MGHLNTAGFLLSRILSERNIVINWIFFELKTLKKNDSWNRFFSPKMSASRYIIICAVKHRGNRNLKSKDLSPASMTLGMYLESRT